MKGNVIEWPESCWKENFRRRVLRGGSRNYVLGVLRSAGRSRRDSGARNDVYGFRVARMFTP